MADNIMADNSGRIKDPCVLLYIIFPLSMVVILFVGLAQPTHIYIQDVYVPALDTSTSTGNGTAPFNASIFVDLKYKRSWAVFRQDLAESELVVYYSQGNSTPAAGCRVGAFGMGEEKTVHKMAAMEARELPWGEAFRAVSGGSIVEMKVEMRKGGGAVLAAHVVVDATGHMAPEGLVDLSL